MAAHGTTLPHSRRASEQVWQYSFSRYIKRFEIIAVGSVRKKLDFSHVLLLYILTPKVKQPGLISICGNQPLIVSFTGQRYNKNAA